VLNGAADDVRLNTLTLRASRFPMPSNRVVSQWPMPQKRVLKILGPGILVAATGVSASDLATGAFTGSQLGMAVLWAVLVGAFLKFVLIEVVGGVFRGIHRRKRILRRLNRLSVVKIEIPLRCDEWQVRFMKSHRQEKWPILEFAESGYGGIRKLSVADRIVRNDRRFPRQIAGLLRLCNAIAKIPHVGQTPMILFGPFDGLPTKLSMIAVLPALRFEQRFAPRCLVVVVEDLSKSGGVITVVLEVLRQRHYVRQHAAKPDTEIGHTSRVRPTPRQHRQLPCGPQIRLASCVN